MEQYTWRFVSRPGWPSKTLPQRRSSTSVRCVIRPLGELYWREENKARGKAGYSDEEINIDLGVGSSQAGSVPQLRTRREPS